MKKTLLLSTLLLSAAIGFSQKPDATRFHHGSSGGYDAYYGDHYSPPAMGGHVVGTSGSYGINAGAQGGGPAGCSTVTTYSTGTMTATGGMSGGGNYGYNSYYGGGYVAPMAICEADFGQIMHAVGSRSFDSDRLMIAKQAVSGRWITADMVRRLLSQFSFESSRLDFAKYAYGQTIDGQNYYVVNDGFTYSSSMQELDDYIRNFR